MLEYIWQEFLNIVSKEVGSRVVETWFKAVSFKRWDSLQKTVYLQAPNAFVKDWISSNYLTIFTIHLSRLLNVDLIRVVFLDSLHDTTDTKETVSTDIIPARVAPELLATNSMLIKRLPRFKSTINKNYHFNSFVVGPSNSLAYAAAHAITEKPGKLYNPLFIYGGSGLGKTHLLHAIGNEIKSHNSKAEVFYQTTDRFVNEFIHAIRYDKIHQFQAKYKYIDVLLIDDVQFISNKEQTQEAFFHIFNTLYESHKQIVFSSDSYPADIKGIAERLSSRLAGGLVTDIQVPTVETKIAILKHKAELNNEQLSDDIAEFIASNVVCNIRELEGALIRVIAYASLTKQPVTLELTKKVLLRSKDHIPVTITFERVIKSIEHCFSYNLEDLRSEKRNKQLSLVRQIAMYLMKKMTNKTLHEVGYFLNRKDHTTVMHAIQKVAQVIEQDHQLAERIKYAEQEILGI